MPNIAYRNLDLLIQSSGPSLQVRASDPDFGECNAGFRLPFSAADAQNILLRVGTSGRDVTTTGQPGQSPVDEDVLKNFGTSLFNAIFSGDVANLLRKALAEATRTNAMLRIRLILAADTPLLANLPWEYLYDPEVDDFLALYRKTSLVRYLEMKTDIRPQWPVKPPLRVLTVISSPTNYPQLDVNQEWAKLNQALGDLQYGQVDLVRTESATLAALRQQLSGSEFHIFHFIGHGSFDEQIGEGVLLFEDEQGLGRPVSGQILGKLLRSYDSLRLVLLNACKGARATDSNAFAGTAQSLVKQGIPVVIAMQFEITDKTAIQFSQEFYTRLAASDPVDAALAEARKAIYFQSSPIEWATPVLYMRSPDGLVFKVESLTPEQQKAKKIEALLTQAQAAKSAENWPLVEQNALLVLNLDSANAKATDLVGEARKRRDLAENFAKGREHYDAGRWQQALDYFNSVQRAGGNYKNVADLIATCMDQISKSQPMAPRPAGSPTPLSPLDNHLDRILRAIQGNQLVVFLGADINQYGRPQGRSWQRGSSLPSTSELTQYLAAQFHYPLSPVSGIDLLRVSQYVACYYSVGDLRTELYNLFAVEYQPTLLHQFFAQLSTELSKKGYPPRFPVIVTTNYDDSLEQAYRKAGVKFDRVTYIAGGDDAGQLLHSAPDGKQQVIKIDQANQYASLNPDQRTVILKLQGAQIAANTEQDNYVITEDQQVDYLTRIDDPSRLLPPLLIAKLKNSHYLFLGYHLRDWSLWNLRVILHDIWRHQRETAKMKSWAIQASTDAVDEKFWTDRGVEVLHPGLEDYLTGLTNRFQGLPSMGGGA